MNWCDAYAYCQGVGKRLCGKIGGGSNASKDFANASLSEWYNACTSHGANAFPYGSEYDGQACNGSDYGNLHPSVSNTTLPVATFAGCQSTVTGYAGVYDLSGNLWEWEDSCTGAGETGACRLRGGSFFLNDVSDYMRCDADYVDTRNPGGYFNIVGFRCCSSP